MELGGKIAVVTGASSGIGEATARLLAREGMRVVAVARRTERLEQLAAEHAAIVPHTGDVTVPDDLRKLADRVREDFGACHVLVNNAGASFGGQFRGWDDMEVLQRTMEVNFYGVARSMAAFAELLFASAPARVVNVASVAGKVGLRGPAYSASKFAVVGLSESVGLDWAGRGVTVTQLNPGFIATEGFPQTELTRSPMGRLVGTPQMVADAILDAARRGPRERTVPRWYRPLVALRHVAAPIFWAIGRRLG